MYSDWQGAAKAAIAEVHESLPADATLQERRAALRKAAFEFHGGTSWGKKTWSKHVRFYLEQHGQPRKNSPQSKQHIKLMKALGQGDLTLPFQKG